ncbi:hypothetical protein WMF27_35165 [Sorangium sp. So ce281]|uniref:hypothetical protein n=1 Tax=unclassified Sorangium TaxID=2621164 RepID=UPI003F5F3003
MAVQFDEPSVAVAFDVNAPMAVETRKKALADAADKGYLVAHTHAPFPGLGHVRRDGESFRSSASSRTKLSRRCQDPVSRRRSPSHRT